MRFALTGGQAADSPQAIPCCMESRPARCWRTRDMKATGYWDASGPAAPTAVIPPKRNRKEPWEYDRELYRQRNLIERAFNKLKHWRRIATRYDRRSIYFLSALYLVSAVIWG